MRTLNELERLAYISADTATLAVIHLAQDEIADAQFEAQDAFNSEQYDEGYAVGYEDGLEEGRDGSA